MQKQKAIGYLRISGEDHDDNFEKQRDTLQKYADLHNLSMEFIEDRSISGYRDDRDGLVEVFEKIESGQYSHIVVRELSRLSRKVVSTLRFFEKYIDTGKIKFVSIKESIDTGTPTGKLFLTILSAFNQWYRDDIAIRCKVSYEKRRRLGFNCGGNIPFGYTKGPDNKLVPYETEQRVINQVLAMLNKGLQPEDIRFYFLTKTDFKTKNGKFLSKKIIGKIKSGKIKPVG